MKRAQIMMLAVGCFVTVSCGVQGEMAPVPMMDAASSRSSAGDGVQQRKLIKKGSMLLKTAQVAEAAKQVEEVVKQQGGRIEDKTEGEDVSMEIRVPAAKLEVTMEAFSMLGKVTYRKVWEQDVTNEYIDTEAKLKNLRVLRDRLRVLYQKATKVADMLKIEKELARVQGELDSLEGRMKAMRHDVAFSELDLEIERMKIPGPVGAVGKGIAWVAKKLWVMN